MVVVDWLEREREREMFDGTMERFFFFFFSEKNNGNTFFKLEREIE